MGFRNDDTPIDGVGSMKRAERPNIRAIAVEFNEVDDDHHEITITLPNVYAPLEPATCHLYNDVTDAEVWRAANEGAGLIARIGVWAAPFIALERQNHHCGGKWSVDENAHPPIASGCHVTAPWVLLRPSADYGDPPAVWIYVPTKRVKHWRGLIDEWLKALADEQAWGYTRPNAAIALPDNVLPLEQANHDRSTA
jgi:hypothetical protein